MGKRGSRIKANVEKASQKMPENKRPIFEKAWVSVDGCDKNHATVKTDVAKSPYKMFLGWEPEEGDSEMIEVRVSAKASKEDTLEFIGYLSEILDEIIQDVNSKQQRASEDALALLNDLEGLGDDMIDMDDMSEGYSPESP